MSQSDTDVLIAIPWHHREMQRDLVQIRPLENSDRATVERYLTGEWEAPVVVAHGTVFRPAGLPGFIAEQPGAALAGLLPYTAPRLTYTAPRRA